jgi:hypothetical protein
MRTQQSYSRVTIVKDEEKVMGDCSDQLQSRLEENCDVRSLRLHRLETSTVGHKVYAKLQLFRLNVLCRSDLVTEKYQYQWPNY